MTAAGPEVAEPAPPADSAARARRAARRVPRPRPHLPRPRHRGRGLPGVRGAALRWHRRARALLPLVPDLHREVRAPEGARDRLQRGLRAARPGPRGPALVAPVLPPQPLAAGRPADADPEDHGRRHPAVPGRPVEGLRHVLDVRVAGAVRAAGGGRVRDPRSSAWTPAACSWSSASRCSPRTSRWCGCAIKRSPRSKWALCAIGLLPVAVFQSASSVSHDALTTAVSLLVLSSALRALDPPEGTSNRALFVEALLLSAALGLCKPIYVVIAFCYLLPLLGPRRAQGALAARVRADPRRDRVGGVEQGRRQPLEDRRRLLRHQGRLHLPAAPPHASTVGLRRRHRPHRVQPDPRAG